MVMGGRVPFHGQGDWLRRQLEIREGIIEITADGRFRPAVSNESFDSFLEAREYTERVGITEAVEDNFYNESTYRRAQQQIDDLNATYGTNYSVRRTAFKVDTEGRLEEVRRHVLGDDGVARGLMFRNGETVTLFDVVGPNGERAAAEDVDSFFKQFLNLDIKGMTVEAGKDAKRSASYVRPKRIDLLMENDPIKLSLIDGTRQSGFDRKSIVARQKDLLSDPNYKRAQQIRLGTKNDRELLRQLVEEDAMKAIDGASEGSIEFFEKLQKGMKGEIGRLQADMATLKDPYLRQQAKQKLRTIQKEADELDRLVKHGRSIDKYLRKHGLNADVGAAGHAIGNVRLTGFQMHLMDAAEEGTEYQKALLALLQGGGEGTQLKGNIPLSVRLIRENIERGWQGQDLIDVRVDPRNIVGGGLEGANIDLAGESVEDFVARSNRQVARTGEGLTVPMSQTGASRATLEFQHTGRLRLDAQTIMSHSEMVEEMLPKAMERSISDLKAMVTEMDQTGTVPRTVFDYLEGMARSAEFDNISAVDRTTAREAQELLEMLESGAGRIGNNPVFRDRMVNLLTKGTLRGGLIRTYADTGSRAYLMPRMVGNERVARRMKPGQLGFDRTTGAMLVHEADAARVFANLGGFDFDDAMNAVLFRDTDGRIRVMGNRSPTSRGEFLVADIANAEELIEFQQGMKRGGLRAEMRAERARALKDWAESHSMKVGDISKKKKRQIQQRVEEEVLNRYVEKAPPGLKKMPMMGAREHLSISQDTLYYRYRGMVGEGVAQDGPIIFRESLTKGPSKKTFASFVSEASRTGRTMGEAFGSFYGESFKDMASKLNAEKLFAQQQNAQMLLSYFTSQNKAKLGARTISQQDMAAAIKAFERGDFDYIGRVFVGFETEEIIDAIIQGSGKLTVKEVERYTQQTLRWIAHTAVEENLKISEGALENRGLLGRMKKLVEEEMTRRELPGSINDYLDTEDLMSKLHARSSSFVGEALEEFGTTDFSDLRAGYGYSDPARAKQDARKMMSRFWGAADYDALYEVAETSEQAQAGVKAAREFVVLDEMVQKTFASRTLADGSRAKVATARTYDMIMALAEAADSMETRPDALFEISEISRMLMQDMEQMRGMTPGERAAWIADNPRNIQDIERVRGEYFSRAGNFEDALRGAVGDEVADQVIRAQRAFDLHGMQVGEDVLASAEGARIMSENGKIYGLLDPLTQVDLGNGQAASIGRIAYLAEKGDEQAKRVVGETASSYLASLRRIAESQDYDGAGPEILRRHLGGGKARVAEGVSEAAASVAESRSWKNLYDDLAKHKGARGIALAAVGTLGVSVLHSIKNRDITPQDMQGPVNLSADPAPYTTPHVTMTGTPGSYSPPQQGGMRYEVQASGGGQDPGLLRTLGALTGAGVMSTVYGDSFSPDIDSLLGSY